MKELESIINIASIANLKGLMLDLGWLGANPVSTSITKEVIKSIIRTVDKKIRSIEPVTLTLISDKLREVPLLKRETKVLLDTYHREWIDSNNQNTRILKSLRPILEHREPPFKYVEDITMKKYMAVRNAGKEGYWKILALWPEIAKNPTI